MCRFKADEPEFFLVHPGGPFYVKKDEGVWSIPKGLTNPDEELLEAAKREFSEETGLTPNGEYFSLGSTKLKSGKIVHVWMFFGEWDESTGIKSNTFALEWPPKSGKFQDIPEADRGGWFPYQKALLKIHPHQIPFINRAKELLEKATH